jgi:import receptor subunit TOM70
VPEVTESTVASLSDETKKDYAFKLKAAGNKAYGSKDYNRAIELYGQALLCKADPVFYSNRAACWNAMSNWDRVIEDTTAAINLDPEYVKALNRRANAYEVGRTPAQEGGRGEGQGHHGEEAAPSA